MPVIGNQVGLTVDRIVLATDLTSASEPATKYAIALAKRYESSLILTHIVDLSIATRSEKGVVGVSLGDMRRKSSVEMERLLKDFGRLGVRATAHALESHNPADAIIDLSEQLDADLIVAGTHSRHGLSKAILGSCAEGIIRHASCPVLTIGPNAKPLLGRAISFKTIVFATDFGVESEAKASIALAFAQDSGAKIYLCHVLEHDGQGGTPLLELRDKIGSILQKMIPSSAYDWCDPECVIEQGNAATQILSLAQRVSADLIVMGAKRGSSFLVHLNNGIVGDLLGRAECPVMTIASR